MICSSSTHLYVRASYTQLEICQEMYLSDVEIAATLSRCRFYAVMEIGDPVDSHDMAIFVAPCSDTLIPHKMIVYVMIMLYKQTYMHTCIYIYIYCIYSIYKVYI